jgi:spore coat protein U-like protein
MTMTMRRLVAGTAATAIVGTLALSRMTVEAATAQANLTVQASVTANCDVEAPNTLDFGDYDPVVTHASANLDASTTIRVRCTRGSSNVWVGLDSGSNASSSQRRLAGGRTRRVRRHGAMRRRQGWTTHPRHPGGRT